MNAESRLASASADDPATVSFESFTLDRRKHALFRGTERIRLTARPLEVLAHLAVNAGRTVTKTELLETVWKDVFVTEDVLVQAVGEIRRALGDNKQAPIFVQTVPRVGYRFVAAVHALGQQQKAESGENVEGVNGAPVPAAAVSHQGSGSTSPAVAVPAVKSTNAGSGGWLAAGLILALAFFTGAFIWWPARDDGGWRSPVMIADVAGMPRMPTFAPDGRMVAFVNDVDGVDQIFVTDVRRGTRRQLTFAALPARRPRWSPKGGAILFCLGTVEGSGGAAFARESIWAVLPDGGAPHLVLEDARNPNWSRDGTRVVFERRDELWISDAEGGRQRRVNGVPGVGMLIADRWPAFSPDGSQIVFFQPQTGPQGDFWLIPSEGGSPRRLTFDVSDGGHPVWTPDGRAIVFVSERRGVADLWSVPSGGGVPTLLFQATGENGDPDISGDGQRLVFSNTRNQFVLVMMAPGTGVVRELLERRLSIAYPMFSPTGDRLSFFAITGDDGVDQVFTIRADGTDLQQVTRTEGERNTFAHWSADGTLLYHYRSQPDLSYRATAAAGGRSREIVPGWAWEREYGARVDPGQQRIVYTRTRAGLPSETLVREMPTGRERALAKALDDPRWSPDGKSVLGTDLVGAMPPQGAISLCGLEAAPCRAITRGYMPAWNPDGHSISFLRPGESADAAVLWWVSLDGTGERRVADLRPVRPIAHFYDVSPRGDIAYVQLKPGRRDLWVAERR